MLQGFRSNFSDFLEFLVDISLFVGPLIPLFWTSGDVSCTVTSVPYKSDEFAHCLGLFAIGFVLKIKESIILFNIS